MKSTGGVVELRPCGGKMVCNCSCLSGISTPGVAFILVVLCADVAIFGVDVLAKSWNGGKLPAWRFIAESSKFVNFGGPEFDGSEELRVLIICCTALCGLVDDDEMLLFVSIISSLWYYYMLIII